MDSFKLILFALCILFSQISFADVDEDEFYLNRLNHCEVTEEIANDYEPQKFESTNNLLRKFGQVPLFCGEKIIVTGRVLDEDCVPVADAKVYAWQVDCSGRYPYQPLRDMIDEDLLDLNNDTTFTGNGVATTNNNGEFYFVTIYPARAHDAPPHINVRVDHRHLGSLQARLTLRGHRVANPSSKPEFDELASLAQGIDIYSFRVVLPGDGIKTY